MSWVLLTHEIWNKLLNVPQNLLLLLSVSSQQVVNSFLPIAQAKNKVLPDSSFILSCPTIPSVGTPCGYPLETILRIQPLSRHHHHHEWNSSCFPQPCPAALFSLSVLARPCHASVENSHCLPISEPRAPAVEARSLNHCIAREGPETESLKRSPGPPVSRPAGHLPDLISHSSLITSFSCIVSFTLLFLKHTVLAAQWTFVLLGTLSLHAAVGILEILEFLPNVTFPVSCSLAALWNSISPPISCHVFIHSLSSSQLDFSLYHRQKMSLRFVLYLKTCLPPMVGTYQIFVPLMITYKRKSG